MGGQVIPDDRRVDRSSMFLATRRSNGILPNGVMADLFSLRSNAANRFWSFTSSPQHMSASHRYPSDCLDLLHKDIQIVSFTPVHPQCVRAQELF